MYKSYYNKTKIVSRLTNAAAGVLDVFFNKFHARNFIVYYMFGACCKYKMELNFC